MIYHLDKTLSEIDQIQNLNNFTNIPFFFENYKNNIASSGIFSLASVQSKVSLRYYAYLPQLPVYNPHPIKIYNYGFQSGI